MPNQENTRLILAEATQRRLRRGNRIGGRRTVVDMAEAGTIHSATMDAARRSGALGVGRRRRR